MQTEKSGMLGTVSGEEAPEGEVSLLSAGSGTGPGLPQRWLLLVARSFQTVSHGSPHSGLPPPNALLSLSGGTGTLLCPSHAPGAYSRGGRLLVTHYPRSWPPVEGLRLWSVLGEVACGSGTSRHSSP